MRPLVRVCSVADGRCPSASSVACDASRGDARLKAIDGTACAPVVTWPLLPPLKAPLTFPPTRDRVPSFVVRASDRGHGAPRRSRVNDVNPQQPQRVHNRPAQNRHGQDQLRRGDSAPPVSSQSQAASAVSTWLAPYLRPGAPQLSALRSLLGWWLAGRDDAERSADTRPAEAHSFTRETWSRSPTNRSRGAQRPSRATPRRR